MGVGTEPWNVVIIFFLSFIGYVKLNNQSHILEPANPAGCL